MKKVLVILLVVILLAAAAVGGYYWYQSTHIFIEDAVYEKNAQQLDLRGTDISLDHYLQLQAQLPECDIAWDVPFQGKKTANTSKSLAITALSDGDIEMLSYFPMLETIDASQCQDYMMLENLQAAWPELTIHYGVDLGGTTFGPDTTALTLEEGSYDYDALMANLVHLPLVTEITFPKTTLEKAQIQEINMLFPGITVNYTVLFRGQECDPRITELNLSDLTSEEVAEVAEQLAFFPDLTNVELMDESGKSGLTLLDVQTLQEAVPGCTFHYTFTFYKKVLSTTDTEVEYKNLYMKSSDEETIRQVLDVMDNCTRFVFNNCHLSNEFMAQLREDYRGRTKIVWRVFFGNGCSCLTDKEVIKAVYGLGDSNSASLKYCEDARFIDFGHNESMRDISFVSYMPNLEAIILSGSPITDLSAFANSKKLYFLELAYCGYIEDLSPLAGCESLGMLNISYTKVEDLSPVDKLPMERLTFVKTPVSDEEIARYVEASPECWVTYKGSQPYGVGWRYEEDGSQSDYYKFIASKEIFSYANTSDTLW